MRNGEHSDTSSEAQAVQDGLYAVMTGAQRLEIVFRLSAEARDLTCAGIRSRHPEYSEVQVTTALWRILHGDEIVRAVWPDREFVEP